MRNENQIEIVIINLGSCRPDEPGEGLVAAIQASKALNCSTTVVVASKNKYPMTLIKQFLGEQKAELLKNKEKVVLNHGSVLSLESTRTIAKAPTTPVLFLVYVWSEVIPKIKRDVGVKKLIVLVPNEHEVALWEKEFA